MCQALNLALKIEIKRQGIFWAWWDYLINQYLSSPCSGPGIQMSTAGERDIREFLSLPSRSSQWCGWGVYNKRCVHGVMIRTGCEEPAWRGQHCYPSLPDFKQRVAIADQGGYGIPALTGTFSGTKFLPPLPRICIYFQTSRTWKMGSSNPR